MNDIYRVCLKLHTSLGVFTGIASDDFSTDAEAFEERTKLQEVILSCGAFTFFSDTEWGTEITVPHSILQNSIVEFSVTHFKS